MMVLASDHVGINTLLSAGLRPQACLFPFGKCFHKLSPSYTVNLIMEIRNMVANRPIAQLRQLGLKGSLSIVSKATGAKQ